MFQMVLSMEQRLQKAGYSAKTAGTIASNLLTGMKSMNTSLLLLKN